MDSIAFYLSKLTDTEQQNLNYPHFKIHQPGPKMTAEAALKKKTTKTSRNKTESLLSSQVKASPSKIDHSFIAKKHPPLDEFPSETTKISDIRNPEQINISMVFKRSKP